MNKTSYYPGRIVFDHLAKTAGQAINQWLRDELGTGSITQNLIGSHKKLLSLYGGRYPIISGHLSFFPGEELDPRYRYITLLREPVDRTISWMFYLIHNVEHTPETSSLIEGAKLFLASDGLHSSPEFENSITNYYVKHFSRIAHATQEDYNIKLLNAYSAITQYDVVGIYEQMSDFLASVADLIGIPVQSTISKVNVTLKRIDDDQVSPKLRQRIIDLNQFDLRFYSDIVAWKKIPPKEARKRIIKVSPWQKYDIIHDLPKVVVTADLPEITAVLQGGDEVVYGQLMTFNVVIKLFKSVENLSVGISVLDERQAIVFRTNSVKQKKQFSIIRAGEYLVAYHLCANLPAGKYLASFSFAEILPDGSKKQLAFYEQLCNFTVVLPKCEHSVGCVDLPIDISLTESLFLPMYFTGDNQRLFTEVGKRNGGSIQTAGQKGFLVFGPYVAIPPGVYQIKIYGGGILGNIDNVWVDVVADKGQYVFAEAVLGSLKLLDNIWLLEVAVDRYYSDIEVRIRVEAETELSIFSITIEQCI